jgi:succinate dehydrogenase hydrophobic anchor subunit
LWHGFGYRNIPDIGSLFVTPAISGVICGLVIMLVSRVWSALIGIAIELATMLGFLLSVAHGLSGFRESWQDPHTRLALSLELAAIAMLFLATQVSVAISP